jgi:hypothetical protein
MTARLRGRDWMLAAISCLAVAGGCRSGHGSGPLDGGAGGGGAGGGGAGGSGAGGGAGAGGADGGSPLAGCPGLALTQSGTLDLDIGAVSVSGKVTVDGAPLSTAVGPRGRLVFSAGSGRTTATFDLGSTGVGAYALRLPPATYDVTYRPDPTQCAPGAPASPLPCSGGPLARGVKLTSDGVLDLDIPTVGVSGAVTLGGASFPTGVADRGTLTFVGPAGTIAGAFGLGSSGPAAYQGRLIPGSYDVFFNGAPVCAQAVAPAEPCNSGPLRRGVALSSSGVLDLDVPVARVSGRVTLNGAPLPTEAGDRGTLQFVGAAGSDLGAANTAPLGSGGSGSYAVALLPGVYDVVLAANGGLCTATQVSSVPCVSGRVLSGVRLVADGTLDVDLHAVTVSGAVTVRGAPMPAAAVDRGRLAFAGAGADAGSGMTPSFGTSGAASYQLRVLAGTYDVAYVPGMGACSSASSPPSPPPLPCNGGTLRAGVTIAADGVLDVDIPVAAVSGRVTLNGQPMPTASLGRGALSFTPSGATATAAATMTAPFAASGAVAYGLSLLPGSYDVGLAANAQLCGPGAAAPAVPCVGGTLRAAVKLDADGTLDVDVPSVSVSGKVTLDGAALPAATLDRGSLVFTRAPAEGGGSAQLPLGTSSPASYALTVVQGRYVVTHAANTGSCAGTTPPQIPCASQVLAGCD